MTFEAFQQIILLLKKDSDKSMKLYKFGFDDLNLKEGLHDVITILLKSHYSEAGEDWISWWLWEDVKRIVFDEKGEEVVDLTNVEDLWKYVEEIRKSDDFKEYVPKKKRRLTEKQLRKLFGEMLLPEK